MVEMGRRALANAYSLDKAVCTFVRRPPRISQRYCSIQLQVDLDYGELALEGAELQAALSTIDQNGWTTNFKSRKSCYLRVCILSSLLREEEVLELSLGPPREEMHEKAMDIMARNLSLWQSLPDHVHFNPSSKMGYENVAFAAEEYLDILYNEFMLRWMLVRQLRYDPDELFDVAHRILSAMLEVCAVKFLSVPRSKLIQDLSVFIASLKWVHAPCEGNYQLVQQAWKMSQQILDHILSDVPSSSHQERVQRLAALPSPEPTGHGSAGADEQFDFSWLGNAHPLLS
ncbi:hypothetical protein DV737_g4239, partial [Chaetothyriales sp. CBS 132003]